MKHFISEHAIIGEPPEHREYRDRPNDYWSPMIGNPVRIEAGVTIDSELTSKLPTVISDGVWLMKKVHVGHGAQIGPDCEIAPLANILGEVQIGKGVKIGGSAVIKPRVKVGDGARIGMGAVVTKDVPAGEVWVGNPARKLDKRP